MLPVGPLMIEHRLIERMIKQLKEKSQSFQKENKVDIIFIDKAVDFMRFPSPYTRGTPVISLSPAQRREVEALID